MTIKIYANAKINLFLHIVGASGDYHLLESLVVFLDLADEINVMPSDSLIVEFDTTNINNFNIDPINNTITNAAQLLAKCYDIKPTGYIQVKKNIPVGSGMGGGSADAAAVLRILPKLWGMPEIDLRNIAARCGCDVSVCLDKVPAIMSGIGENIKPIDFICNKHIVVAMDSDCYSLTSEVYKKFDAMKIQHDESLIPALFEKSHTVESIMQYKNSLYKAAAIINPQIYSTLHDLSSSPGCILARMSGSGAACFGIFNTQDEANYAVKELKKLNYWAVTVNIYNHTLSEVC